MSAPPSTSAPSRFVRLARLCNRHRWRTFGAWLLALVAIQVDRLERRRQGDLELPAARHREPARLRPARRALPGGQGRHATSSSTGRAAARCATARSGRASRPRSSGSRPTTTSPRVTSPFGPGGRLTEDGRIGVATLNYKESTNDITPADLETIQNAAFTARSPRLAGRARRPGRRGRALHQQPGPVGGHRHLRRRDRPARSRSARSWPPACRWWRRCSRSAARSASSR